MDKKKSTKSTTSSPEATIFTESRNPLSSLFKNKVFLLALLAVLVIGLVIAGYALYKHHKDSVGDRVVCSPALLKTASDQNSQGAVDQQALTIGQVKALVNYTRDPNCMYAVTEYQISSGDISSAKTSISDLKKKHSTFMFSKSLDGGSASIANLQKQFDVMQNAQKNAKGSIDPSI